MSIKEKCNPLVAVLLVVVIALITAISVLLIQRFLRVEETKKRPVCKTRECINLAHRLHNYGDPTVDPCVDFWQATCGKYKEHIHVFTDQMTEKLTIIYRMMDDFLRRNKTSEVHSENVLRTAYQTCRREGTNSVAVKRDLLNRVQSIGSLPVLDPNWNPDDFNLNEWLIRMANLSVYNLAFFWLRTDERNFVLLPPSKMKDLPPENEMINTIVSLLKANEHPVTQTVMNTIVTDVKSVKSLFDVLSNQTKITRLVSYAQLKRAVPEIEFDRILDAWLPSVPLGQAAPRLLIGDWSIFFSHRYSISKLSKSVSPRVLANLLLFTYISYATAETSTWNLKHCDVFVVAQLPQGCLRVFVRNHFNRDNLRVVDQMVDELKVSYAKMFEESAWLSESTKQSALRKLEKMSRMVGFPDGWEEDVEKSYEKLDIPPTDSLLEVIAKATRFRVVSYVQHLFAGTGFDPIDEHLSINAYYLPTHNHLAINTAIMDDPMFDASYPMYARLAGNGQVLGHEIGHGFDSGGMNRDENGVERNWWTPEDRAVFEKKAQCFVEQYDNYDDPDFGKRLKGVNTLKEMLADQLGTANIWLTYKRLHTSDAPSLVGFEDYDTDKLFFRISALNWCSAPSLYPLDAQLKRRHPTKSFRVNGVVSNMRQFAEAFGCPRGSPMNPAKKCDVF